MSRTSTVIGYIASAIIVAVGAAMFTNNTDMLPSPTGDGMPETIIFSISIILAGLSSFLYQYKKSKATKYFLYSLSLFSVVSHSATFTIRMYPNTSISNSGIALLIAFILLNMYLFYLSYSHYRNS